MRNDILPSGTPFFCDLYHLTMAQAWFKSGKHSEPKTSEAFFRKCPFGGSYLLSAGLGEFLQWADNWKISTGDIDYLASLSNRNGTPLFAKDFLEFLKGQRLELDIRAVPEGEIVFPDEPVLSVSGPCWQVDMVESAFLNIFNAQSLIATKASRMVTSASADGIKRPVMEFGLRRAQDLGCFLPTRAAFIGGCSGTSNVKAAQYYGIPPKGTMAHSFVMSYADELDAFKAYMRASAGNTVLLVDTYDTRQGIKNAIKAAKETGIELQGLRIDSGDLAYWAKEARYLLDKAGMPQVELLASNDLDEHLIENLIMVQHAPYNAFAAGTKLVTAYDTPALGGVYKTKQYNGAPKIKIAEGKTTIPGATNVIRIIKNGMFEGDVITRREDNLLENGKLKHSLTSWRLNSTTGERVSFAAGEEAYGLLKPVMANGEVITTDISRSLGDIQTGAAQNLNRLDKAYKRLANPHLYGVGLEQNLYNLRQNLIKQHQER